MKSLQAQGAFWKVLSCLCFAGMNGVIKVLSLRLSPATIAFFEHAFGVLWILPFWMRHPQKNWRTHRLDLQIWRVVLACSGVICFYQALSVLPLSQAVALSFTGPLVTILGARIFFKERLSWPRILAIGLGLCGSAVIINARYMTQEISWGAQGWEIFLPFFSAAAFSGCNLINKKLTQYDDPLTIVAYLMVCMVPFFGIVSWPSFVFPHSHDIFLLMGLGFLNVSAYWALSRSFVCSDMIFLLPFGAVKFVTSALIGYVAFSQSFNPFVLGGFSLILGGIFFVMRFDKKDEVS